MVEERFDKSRRLLKPRDFRAVFDDATFKVSSRELLILARPNALGCARLGLVVAKRHLRLSVQRNRAKRVARESFRHCQAMLSGLDGIVLARAGLDGLDNRALRLQLDHLWRQLARKAAKRRTEGNPC